MTIHENFQKSEDQCLLLQEAEVERALSFGPVQNLKNSLYKSGFTLEEVKKICFFGKDFCVEILLRFQSVEPETRRFSILYHAIDNCLLAITEIFSAKIDEIPASAPLPLALAVPSRASALALPDDFEDLIRVRARRSEYTDLLLRRNVPVVASSTGYQTTSETGYQTAEQTSYPTSGETTPNDNDSRSDTRGDTRQDTRTDTTQDSRSDD